jgi:hypothetical protein
MLLPKAPNWSGVLEYPLCKIFWHDRRSAPLSEKSVHTSLRSATLGETGERKTSLSLCSILSVGHGSHLACQLICLKVDTTER